MAQAAVNGGVKKLSPEQISAYLRPREVLRLDRGQFTVMVDGFQYTKQLEESRRSAIGPDATGLPLRTTYFLSHFHSDHYVGLFGRWPHGTIFCSQATAKLTELELKIQAARLQPLEMGAWHRLDLREATVVRSEEPMRPHELEVALVNANHCPGAVLFLFRSPTMGVVVHTGDFRWNGASTAGGGSTSTPAARPERRSLQDQKPKAKAIAPGLGRSLGVGRKQTRPRTEPVSSDVGSGAPLLPEIMRMGDDVLLQSVCGKADVLFLDNTFCDPAYLLPSQEESFRSASVALRESVRKRFDALMTARVGQVAVVMPQEPAADPHGEAAAPRQADAPTPAKSLRSIVVRVAILVGTYTIGKERIAMALRRFLQGSSAADAPTIPIYASRRKIELIRCSDGLLEEGDFRPTPTVTEDIPADAAEDADASPVERRIMADVHEMRHAVSAEVFGLQGVVPTATVLATVCLCNLGTLQYPRLADAAKEGSIPLWDETTPPRNDGDDPDKEAEAEASTRQTTWLPLSAFDLVFGVEGTGWAAKHSPSRRSRRVDSVIETCSVPYSEHCAFQELIEFVGFLRPRRVVPTVSHDQFREQEPLFVERCARLRSEYSNVQPLARFFASASMRAEGSGSLAPPKPAAEVHTVASQSSDDVIDLT